MIYRKEFQVQINEGPSKMDLFLSLATCMAKKPNHPFEVSFKTAPGQDLEKDLGPGDGYVYRARIKGLSHEDGSGDSFCIDGTLVDDANGKREVKIYIPFTGYYHARTREGYVKFERDFADNR